MTKMRRFVLALLFPGAVLVACLLGSSHAYAGGMSPAFKLLTKKGDYCLDLKGKGTSDNNVIHQWKCNRDFVVAKHKLWKLSRVGRDRVKIHSVKAPKMCIANGRHGKGWRLRLRSCRERSALFKIIRCDDGWLQFQLTEGRWKGRCLGQENGKAGKEIVIASEPCGCRRDSQKIKLHIPRSHKMFNTLQRYAKKATAVAMASADFARQKARSSIKNVRSLSRKAKSKVEKYAARSLKVAKQVGDVTEAGLKKAYKGTAKVANTIGNGVKSATKATLDAAKKAYNDFKDKVVRDKVLKAAEAFASLFKDHLVGEMTDKIKELVDSQFKNKLKGIVQSKRYDLKKLAGGNTGKRRSLRMKFGIPKMNVKQSIKKAFNPKNLKKSASKGNVIAKIAAIAAELGFLHGWAALECAVQGHRSGCALKECFAYKASDKLFDYVYGIPMGEVLNVVSLPAVGACTVSLSPLGALPGVLLLLPFACQNAVGSIVGDIADNLIKSRIKNAFWTGGPKWHNTFIKLYRGTPGAFNGNTNRLNAGHCRGGSGHSGGHVARRTPPRAASGKPAQRRARPPAGAPQLVVRSCRFSASNRYRVNARTKYRLGMSGKCLDTTNFVRCGRFSGQVWRLATTGAHFRLSTDLSAWALLGCLARLDTRPTLALGVRAAVAIALTGAALISDTREPTRARFARATRVPRRWVGRADRVLVVVCELG